MTRDKKMGQSEVRDFDSLFCQTVMRKTIGANWTRAIIIKLAVFSLAN